MHDLSILLLLVATPGLVILLALGIYYVSIPHIDAQTSHPAEALAEVAPDTLEQFTQNTLEQIAAISKVLHSATSPAAHVDKPVDTYETTGAQTHTTAPGSSIDPTRDAAFDEDIAKLVANMREMAALTASLQDKKQFLDLTTSTPVLVADNTVPISCYLSFTLRDESFAVSTLNVCGVVEATQLITQPNLSTRLRRAIKLRGALVPVIDLGAYLGGEPIKIGRGASIVILEVTIDDRMQMIGVVVDEVGKVEKIHSREIESLISIDDKIYNDFTLGTITVDNHAITLLDIERGLLAGEFVGLRSTTRSQALENISRR